MNSHILTISLLLASLSLHAQNTAVTIDDPIDSVREWISLGREALDKGDEIIAIQYFNKCAGVVSAGESLRINGSMLFNVGRIYRDTGDLLEAEKYILKSIELAKALNYTSIVPPRYSILGDIYLELGQSDKALDAALEGRKYAEMVGNPNMISQLEILQADALDALGAKPEEVQALYEEAIDRLKRKGAGKIKYQEAYKRLAVNALKQGDTTKACEYYKNMLIRDWWGGDDLQIMTGARALSDLLDDPVEAAYYTRMADSLSYAPDLRDFNNALAMSSIEFPRRQRDAEILRQKQRVAFFTILAVMLLIIAILLGALLAQRSRISKELESKNADLVKISLQKDRLLAIARASVESSASKEEIKEISDDEVPMPEVKLTPREIEVARLSSQGLQNKEIAAQLGISPLTVGVHKNNLYRKLGIGNNIELLRYMQKVGL